jgi:ammonia channel protein AmtB
MTGGSMQTIGGLIGVFLLIGPYIQHFIRTIENDNMVLLVIGALLFPLGWLHGLLIWLGVL